MTDLVSAHLVSIAHDPMEEDNPETRLDWYAPVEDQTFISPDLRPWLLAASVGLFAAWLMSGRQKARVTSGPEGMSSQEAFELDALNP